MYRVSGLPEGWQWTAYYIPRSWIKGNDFLVKDKEDVWWFAKCVLASCGANRLTKSQWERRITSQRSIEKGKIKITEVPDA